MLTTSFYAAVLALLFVTLSIRTIRARRRLEIAIGDAGDVTMLRMMRVHSNFAEYVPFSLLLIYFVESTDASQWLVHGLGLALLIGRFSHAYGVSQLNEKFAFRVTGMVLTFTCILGCAGYLLSWYIGNLFG